MLRPVVLVAVAVVLVVVALALVVFRPENWVAVLEGLAVFVGSVVIVAGVVREVRRR